MKKAIIRNNIILLISFFILFFWLFFYALFIYRTNEQKTYMTYLIKEVSYTYHLLDQEPTVFIETMDLDDSRRITILDQQGFVLADTHSDVIGTDKSGRPEIKDLGSIHTRNSKTINRDLMYIATLLDDGNILRISVELDPLISLYENVLLIFTLGGLILIVVFYLGLDRISRNLLKPWIQVKHGLIALNQGHYHMMSLTNPYQEINDIMHEMNMINIETNKNLNQITTYQLQLDQILNEMKQGVMLINSKDELIYYNEDAKKMFDLSEQSLNHSIYQIIRNSQLNEAIKIANATHQNSVIDFNYHQQTIEAKILASINPKSYHQSMSLLVLLKDVSQERAIEQMKKDFFSHASHELKSPLTAIKGHAELIMHGIVKEEEINKSLEQILKQSETMSLLVEDMLMLSRLENLSEKTYQELNLSIILHEVIDHLNPIMLKKNIQLEKNIEDIIYQADELDMQKLFKNIIENAIKYSKDNKSIDIELKKEEDMISFTVKDQGIGISEEHQKRVFERFYRVDKGRLDGGTGLGLAIVKHIVLKYEGHLDLKSTLGIGTTIEIQLPLVNQK